MAAHLCAQVQWWHAWGGRAIQISVYQAGVGSFVTAASDTVVQAEVRTAGAVWVRVTLVLAQCTLYRPSHAGQSQAQVSSEVVCAGCVALL